MQKSYIKEDNFMQYENLNSYSNLLNNINMVKNNLKEDYNNMQYVVDDELLDYYTYKIKSDEAQYNYLIKKLKNYKITKKVDIINKTLYNSHI